MPDFAEIFWTAGGQAVRLPAGYRFDAREVSIRREGDRVYLEPIDGDVAADLDQTKARKVAELRRLVQEGLDSGDDEPWDAEEVKRFARRDER